MNDQSLVAIILQLRALHRNTTVWFWFCLGPPLEEYSSKLSYATLLTFAAQFDRTPHCVHTLTQFDRAVCSILNPTRFDSYVLYSYTHTFHFPSNSVKRQANKPNKIQSQNCPIISTIWLQDLLVANWYNLIKSWHGEVQCSSLLCLQFFGFHTGFVGLKQWHTQEFCSGGFNKFIWGQRTERTGIWER